ncbi:MAG: winged-helix domain-containing protein [Bdellovibrionales bacterium]
MKTFCITRDPRIVSMLENQTRQSQVDLTTFADGSDYRQSASGQAADLVIWDADTEVLRPWLSSDSAGPVILVLKSDLRPQDWAEAFEAGADACWPKEQLTEEALGASLRAWEKKSQRLRGYYPDFDLAFDSERQQVESGGRRLALTSTEMRLLRELAKSPNSTVARKKLHKAGDRALDVHICALRKKIKGFGLDIESSRGVGYRLRPCRE